MDDVSNKNFAFFKSNERSGVFQEKVFLSSFGFFLSSVYFVG